MILAHHTKTGTHYRNTKRSVSAISSVVSAETVQIMYGMMGNG